jgi:hypothetical protein
MGVVKILVNIAFVNPLAEEVLQGSVFTKFNKIVKVVYACYLCGIANEFKSYSSISFIRIHWHAKAIFIH